MWPIIGGLVSGGASLLGSMFSAEQSGENVERNIEAQRAMQHETQSFNAAQAQLSREHNSMEAGRNRQFQEQMSNSAYQRAMYDMKAAGLNPILAYKQGGAGTPTGAQGVSSPASVSSPNMALHNASHPLAGLGDAVGRVVNSAIGVKTFEKMTDEIANIQADTARKKAEERLTGQREATEFEETHRRKAEGQASHLRLEGEKRREEEEAAIRAMPQWLRDLLIQGAYSGRQVGDVVSTAAGVRRLLPQRSTREVTTTDTHGHGRSTFEERFRGF